MSHIAAILQCQKECQGDPFNVRKWKKACVNYGGELLIQTCHELMILNLDDKVKCTWCGCDPCLWVTLGDKLIDLVILEFNPKKINPTTFRQKLESTFISLCDGSFVPKCCRMRYKQLFPNKQIPMIKDSYDAIPKEDEYDSDEGPYWIYEDDLFCHL